MAGLGDDIRNLGVKFYASKTKAEALALASTEPGALCFVSDNTGNYVILDGKIFGDGTSGSGGGGGGAVDSVNGHTGTVILHLNDFDVVEINNVTKTLADYFDIDGAVISSAFKVKSGNDTLVTIDSQGIRIGNNAVATESAVSQLISQSLTTSQGYATTAEIAAKAYADTLIASVYRVKGSVQNYSQLTSVSNPKVGDVYNVISSGMNYVYTEDGWDALGGTIDLSNYYTKSEVDTQISNAINTAENYAEGLVSGYDTRITANANAISNLGTAQQQQQTSISNLNTSVQANTTNINNLATQLTWQ